MLPPELTRPLCILVVEDNFVNQRLIEAFLEDAGHTPVLAGSGRDALAALERQSFDLVLMDIQMPGMDGLEATAAIRVREESTGTRIRILAMTAYAGPEDRERCLAAGMDGHVAKPVRYEELIALIGSVASREQEPLPAAGIRGRAGLRKELTRRFVADAEQLHAEMREAIRRRNGAALQRAAHSLRGTAGFFAADGVFDLARRLEELGKAEDFGAYTDRAAQDLGEELTRLARLTRPTPPPPA